MFMLHESIAQSEKKLLLSLMSINMDIRGSLKGAQSSRNKELLLLELQSVIPKLLNQECVKIPPLLMRPTQQICESNVKRTTKKSGNYSDFNCCLEAKSGFSSQFSQYIL